MGLFGKKKIDPQTIVDGAISGIDKMFFTNEEKSESAKKIVDAQADFVKSTLNASTTSSKTRRYIAVIIVAVFMLLILGAAVGYLWDKEYATFLYNVAKNDLGALVMMVAGFYFGGYMISNHFLSAFNKKKK